LLRCARNDERWIRSIQIGPQAPRRRFQIHAAAAGIIFELILPDPGNAEIFGLVMPEIKARNGGGGQDSRVRGVAATVRVGFAPETLERGEDLPDRVRTGRAGRNGPSSFRPAMKRSRLRSGDYP
jgi:hypothetical protein